MRELRFVASAALLLIGLSGCGASRGSAARELEAMPAGALGAPLEPATFTQLADHVDLRKIPVPEDAKLQSREIGALYMVLSRDTQATVEFVRQQMAKLGCKEVKSDTPSTPPYVSLAFTGGGCLVTAFLSPDDSQKNTTNLVMNGVGNIDARSLPQPAGVTPLASFWTSQTVTTEDDLDQAVAAARETLHKAGWGDVVRVGRPDQSATGEQRFFNVFKSGINIGVYVSTVAPPPEQSGAASSADAAGKTSIQYSCTLMDAELPLPADATEVEFAQEPGKLTCHSATSLADVATFYQTRFEKLGWKKWKNRGVVREKFGALFFVRGNDVTMIDLAADDQGTHITLRGMPEEIQADEKQAHERDKQAQEDNRSNLVDLPLPDDAREVHFDEESRKVTFKTEKGISDLVSYYQQAFAADGWQEREANRSVLEATGNFNAYKDHDDIIFVNMFREKEKTSTEVTALAYGCRWNKKPGVAEQEPTAPAEVEPAAGKATAEEEPQGK